MKASLALASLALALPFAAFAADAPGGSVPTQSVRIVYAKSELLRPGAVADLEERVRAAARRVCASSSTSLADRMASDRCYDDALASALKQIDAAKSYAAAALHSPTAG
jgi:UrcA family protein